MYSKFRGYCALLSVQQGTLKGTLKFRVSVWAATCRETLFVLYPAIRALGPTPANTTHGPRLQRLDEARPGRTTTKAVGALLRWHWVVWRRRRGEAWRRLCGSRMGRTSIHWRVAARLWTRSRLSAAWSWVVVLWISTRRCGGAGAVPLGCGHEVVRRSPGIVDECCAKNKNQFPIRMCEG
jgi:hypothetical protein